MNLFARTINGISEWSGRLFSFIFYAGAGIMIAEVIMRYVINTSTMVVDAYVQRIFAVYYIIGGAYVLLHKGHINIDIISNLSSRKGKAILELILLPLPLLFIGVLLYYGTSFAWSSIKIKEMDTNLILLLYPIKAFIPISSFLLILQMVPGVIENLRIIFTRAIKPKPQSKQAEEI